MKSLGELLGRWKSSPGGYGALVGSKSFAAQRRLEDNDALAYGGPFLLGESMTKEALAFFACIPEFVGMLEGVAATPCACSPALGNPCPRCNVRRALALMARKLPQQAVTDTCSPAPGEEVVF